jgi:molybdate transport system ATP-binding protein
MAEKHADPGQGLNAALTLRRGALAIAFEASLPASGVTALFGPSGAGKTSCLRMIAGLDRAAGRLSFAGETWQDSARRVFVPPHRRRIGYVAQAPGLFDHLDVAGNLDFAWRRAGRPQRLDREGLIDQFGVRALLARRVGGLSGGERQRVAIVRAMLSDPVLLLLDEPLTGLDGAAREDLLGRLEALHARLAAPMMIYVSHAIDEVARLADHIVLLDAGGVAGAGPLNAVVTRLDLPPALIEAAGAVIEGVVTAHDPADHLTELSFDGGVLLTPRERTSLGERLRCRIAARDVVLTTERQAATSALNQLACRVIAIGDADHPSQCLVQLDAGGTPLLARITRRSLRALDLEPGKAVWAQVKAVALGA